MRHKQKRSGAAVLLFRVIPLLILTGLLVWALEAKVRPVLDSMATHQARVYAVRCVNTAMAKELLREDVDFSNIVRITHNEQGQVTSIRTDMSAVGRLQTSATESILRQLEDPENSTLRIPAGTLFGGSALLSGRGPSVTVRIMPLGSVQTRLYQQFTEAGINQTLHRIMLEVDFQVATVFPGYVVATDTTSSYAVAETVIVGKVPDAYLQIGALDILSPDGAENLQNQGLQGIGGQ